MNEMGEDELHHSRAAVAGVNVVAPMRGAVSEGQRGALPVATEEEKKMRKDSEADWPIVDEVLEELEVIYAYTYTYTYTYIPIHIHIHIHIHVCRGV